jgi:hypothetical protein
MTPPSAPMVETIPIHVMATLDHTTFPSAVKESTQEIDLRLAAPTSVAETGGFIEAALDLLANPN